MINTSDIRKRDVEQFQPMPNLRRAYQNMKSQCQLIIRSINHQQTIETCQKSCNLLLKILCLDANYQWIPEKYEIQLQWKDFEVGGDETPYFAATGRLQPSNCGVIWLNRSMITSDDFNTGNQGHSPVDGVSHFTMVVLHELGHILQNSPFGSHYYLQIWQQQMLMSNTSILSLPEYKLWLAGPALDLPERLADVFAHQIAQCYRDNCDFESW